jgi:hypothetical protein
VAGVSSLGLAAAAQLGVALERLVVIADPPPAAWATVAAALVDAFDVVLLRIHRRVNAADARRLGARARERGAVLVLLGDDHVWPQAPDLRVTITSAVWEGIGDGHGHLQARRVVVETTGRRAAARPRRAELWLPAPGGGVATAEPLAAVRPLHPPVADAS